MSRDFLSTQVRVGNIIGGNLTEGQPNLTIYSKDHATNKTGGKNNSLSSYLSNTDNFPANTLAIFYGTPTTDTETAVIANPGSYSTVFASDIVVQGTIFVNVLRDINGNLIDFSSGTYISNYNQNGIDLTGANSAESADEILAEKISTNTTLINNLTINSIENIVIDESIADDILLYWNKNNDRYETKSSSLLSSLPSIKLHSDVLTDQILANNPFTGLAENYNTTLSDTLGNQFALLWSTDQEKFIPGEIVLSSVTDSIQVNIDTIESDIDSIQTLLDIHESSIGLDNDGTYSPPVGTNYIDSAVSIRNETRLLDVQVGINTSNISSNTDNISTNTTNIADLQDELDTTQTGSGLNEDGTYTADNTTNYINTATSLKIADSLLDAQIKSNTDNISTNTINISDLQDELDATQLGVGLNEDGTYTADNASNYIGAATSLKNADSLLDAQIKSNTDNIETLDGRVDSAFTSITTNAANIATNAQNIAAIQQGAQNQAEVDQIETSLGLDTDGSLIEYTSTNFISNAVDQDPQDTYFDAINKLDDAISTRSIFNILGIDDTNKADGKILQYNLNDNQFVYVDPQAGPAGADGADGIDGVNGLDGADGESVLFKGQVSQVPSGNGDVTLADGITTFTPSIANVVILSTDSTIYFYNGNDWVSGGSIKGDTGPAGADGADGINGLDGADGADAPTISGITISGNDITTSFDGSDDIVSQNSFSVSLNDLSDVNAAAPAAGQVLKWNDVSQAWEPGSDNVGDNGGADITITDGTTSVGTVETINVSNLATVTNSGNNTATLTGIIGNAEDADYTDGLFVDFTATTPIGTAIDRFNEVLKALAPAPAPDLDQFDVNTSNSLLQNVKLSFGTNNDQSAELTPYSSVDITSGFDATDVNEIFAIESSNGNYRLGVFTGTTTFEGTLNEDVSADQYSNNVINYDENSFGEGDQGTLELWVNGTKIKEIDLSDPLNNEGDYLDANGSGFFNVTAPISGKFSSDTEFVTFKHRQGSWRVHPDSQRDGWNYVQVKHVVGLNTKTTGYADWVNDSNSDQIVVSNKSLTLNMQGSKYISGIQYHTGGTATYSADIDNFYKYVYKSENIDFTESPDTIATFNSIAVPDIDFGAGDDHTKQISLTQTSSLSLINNRLLNQSLSVSFSLAHPIKSNILNVNTSETKTGILIDNVSASSTTTSSFFDDEDYRQIDTNAYTQSGLDELNNTYAWDSSESLVGADSGHNTGLFVYDSKLYSPKSSSIPNNGDFSILSSSHVGNPNYSNIDNSNRVWIRKFRNETGSAVRELLFSMSGNNSSIENNTSLTSSQINVQFKIPSKTGQDETSWLSVADAFSLSDYENNSHTTCGDDINGNMTLGTISNKFASFGLDEIADDDYILAKITAPGNWAGYIDSFTVDFNNVLGQVVSSPEVSNIDTDQVGVTGNLSFGSTNQIANFTDYTQDINYTFDTAGNKSGVFDNTTTITGQINNLTSSNGNNYLQYAFGGDEGNIGTLKLNVNGTDIHTIDLSSIPYLTGNQLNANGSGFTNLTEPEPGRDSNNRPDYSKIWRKSKFTIDPSDQRLGYNFAKIIHVTSSGDEESNVVEWINDNNTTLPTYSNISIDETSISSTESNSLSGVSYYKKVTNIPYTSTINNIYKNVYSNANDAVTVFDVENDITIKSILLTGVNDNTITNNGSHTLSGNNNSDSVALPSINSQNDHLESLQLDSIVSVNYTKSIPDLSSQNPNSNMNDITITTKAKHPLTSPSGTNSSSVTSSKILQYTVSTTTQNYLEETFENETRRLPSGVYSNQNSLSTSWDSTLTLTDGLMVYDNQLIYPKGDFRDVNESGSIISPSSNPDYSSETGTKTFYRIYQNNTQNAQTGFTLNIDGDNTVIVDPATTLSATNIRITVKIPETNDGQATGFMNVAKAFETGNYNDDDGALNGSLSSNISAGSTTSNTVTFGQKYLLTNEFFVLKIEADENWTGYLDNIEIVWS